MSSFYATNPLKSPEGGTLMTLRGIAIALFVLFITSNALGYRRGLKVCPFKIMLLSQPAQSSHRNRHKGGESPPRDSRTLPSTQYAWCSASGNVVEPKPEIRLELAQ